MKPLELPPEAEALIARVRNLDSEAEQIRKRLSRELASISTAAERERAGVARAQAELAHDREALEALLASRVHGIDFIAQAWADYEKARAGALAAALQYKKHPALSAAREVRAQGKELAAVRREAKLHEWVVALYEHHFPWLADLRDSEEDASFVEEAVTPERDVGEGADPASGWLTDAEWQRLTPGERNQLALDRYLGSRKTRWQLGRDYERYIGFLRELGGAKVAYHGILEGFEDLGRDVIADHGDSIEVIQCKRWAQHKTIHEKHIFQLFGTTVLMRLENPARAVRATFTTTTKLSKTARQVAEHLEITVQESVPLQDYPRIKCNIARGSDERIYHLPFDQRYDDTIIEPDRGESYEWTVADAEARGYRRAWRWRGDGAAAS